MAQSDEGQLDGHDPLETNAPFRADESERHAASSLERDRRGTDAREERAKHSVFDEPAIFPHRDPFLIERDWFCRNCTYNLRGLMTGTPCPECGVIERYEPPRPHEQRYAQWLDHERRQSSRLKGWVLVVLCMLGTIPLAGLCAVLGVERTGAFFFLVAGPALGETAKIAACAMVVEQGRFQFGRLRLYAAAIGSALVFSVTQNLIWLNWMYPNSPIELTAWRWTICIILHLVLTAIAASGIDLAGRRAQRIGQGVALGDGFFQFVLAIALHAAVNAIVFFGGFTGYGI